MKFIVRHFQICIQYTKFKNMTLIMRFFFKKNYEIRYQVTIRMHSYNSNLSDHSYRKNN